MLDVTTSVFVETVEPIAVEYVRNSLLSDSDAELNTLIVLPVAVEKFSSFTLIYCAVELKNVTIGVEITSVLREFNLRLSAFNIIVCDGSNMDEIGTIFEIDNVNVL